MFSDSFLVFGAGAWGTALAIQLCRSKQKVVRPSFDKNKLLEIKQPQENKKYILECNCLQMKYNGINGIFGATIFVEVFKNYFNGGV